MSASPTLKDGKQMPMGSLASPVYFLPPLRNYLRYQSRVQTLQPNPQELDHCAIDTGQPVDLLEGLFGVKALNFRRFTLASDACTRAPRWLLASITDVTTSAEASLSDLLEALQAVPHF